MTEVLEDTTTHERTITVKGAPDTPAGYPRGEFNIAPRRILMKWKGMDLPTFIWVEGYRIRKDGTQGTQWRGASFATPGDPNPSHPPLPQWVRDALGLE